MKQEKIIEARKCLTCGKYSLGNYKHCPNCLNHNRNSKLTKVKLKEVQE